MLKRILLANRRLVRYSIPTTYVLGCLLMFLVGVMGRTGTPVTLNTPHTWQTEVMLWLSLLLMFAFLIDRVIFPFISLRHRSGRQPK